MVNRTRPLPCGPIRGQYRVSSDLIDQTRQALSGFYEAGRNDDGHEGICFWAGTERPGVTTFEGVIVPVATHGPFGVFVSAVEFANAATKGRRKNRFRFSLHGFDGVVPFGQAAVTGDA